jgi:hypothetical protein
MTDQVGKDFKCDYPTPIINPEREVVMAWYNHPNQILYKIFIRLLTIIMPRVKLTSVVLCFKEQ